MAYLEEVSSLMCFMIHSAVKVFIFVYVHVTLFYYQFLLRHLKLLYTIPSTNAPLIHMQGVYDSLLIILVFNIPVF